MKLFNILFISLVVFAGCGKEKKKIDEHYEIRNVIKLLMHEQGRYTIVYKEDDEIKMQKVGSGQIRLISEPKIILDAEEDQWAEYDHQKWVGGSGKHNGIKSNIIVNFVVHAKSTDIVQGAGWNHGKSGRGNTTQVIP